MKLVTLPKRTFASFLTLKQDCSLVGATTSWDKEQMLGWLHKHLRRADFTGVLKGERLAEAYANFDLFVFPSRTDTFGNVVLEALAAGVPAIATNSGGPKYILQHGVTGFVAISDIDFIAKVAMLCSNPDQCAPMSRAARQRALRSSWDAVFRHVYDVYENTLSKLRVKTSLVPSWVRA